MVIIRRIRNNSKGHKIEDLIRFFHEFKHQIPEANDIVKLDEEFKNFVKIIKSSEYYDAFFDNYLEIKGYTYRLEDDAQRLFYTFQEAVYAIDLAQLTKDKEAAILNAVVYAQVISESIDEYLNKEVDVDLKQKAIAFYKDLEAQRAKEQQKYHVYQY